MVLADEWKVISGRSLHGSNVYRSHIFLISCCLAIAKHPDHSQIWAFIFSFFTLALAMLGPRHVCKNSFITNLDVCSSMIFRMPSTLLMLMILTNFIFDDLWHGGMKFYFCQIIIRFWFPIKKFCRLKNRKNV